MTKKKLLRFLLKIFSVLAFIVVCIFALFLAYGYQYNLADRHVQKTSIIDIANRSKNVRIFLDNQFIGDELPYQIKGVLAGNHFLSVEKQGYLNWSRRILVQDDLVFKIGDLLLFPANLDAIVKPVSTFLGDARFFAAKNVLVVVRPQQDLLTVISFEDDGSTKETEVSFKAADILDVKILQGEHLLISFRDKSFIWLQINANRMAHFSLPAGVTNPGAINPQLSISNQSLYYSYNKGLYRVPFDKLVGFGLKPGQKNELSAYLLRSGIEQFALAQRDIYFLAEGVLFKSDLDGKNVTVPHLFLQHFTDLALLPADNGAYLVLRSAVERDLYFIDQNSVRFVTHALLDRPLLNEEGQILYATVDGSSVFFDPAAKQQKFVHQFQGDFRLINWFSTHFIFEQNGSFYLSDLDFSNVNAFRMNDKPVTFFPKQRKLFYLSENKLKVLAFD